MNGYFEIELKKALDMLLEEEIKEIENMDMPDFVFSRRHERRMEKIFNAGNYKSFAVRKAFKIFVAALLSVLLGIGVAATVSKEFREVLEDTVIKISDSISAYITHGKAMSSFSLNKNHNPSLTYITDEKATMNNHKNSEEAQDTQVYGIKKWDVYYLPEGYEIVYEWFSCEDMGSVSYGSSEEKEKPIHFDYSPIESNISFNNEDVYFDTFEEDGVVYTAVVSYEDGNRSNMIFWVKEQTIFTVTSKIEIDELKKIAFSVKKVK